MTRLTLILIAFSAFACGPDGTLGPVDLSDYQTHPTRPIQLPIPSATEDGGSELEKAEAPIPTCQKQCPVDAGAPDAGTP